MQTATKKKHASTRANFPPNLLPQVAARFTPRPVGTCQSRVCAECRVKKCVLGLMIGRGLSEAYHNSNADSPGLVAIGSIIQKAFRGSGFLVGKLSSWSQPSLYINHIFPVIS